MLGRRNVKHENYDGLKRCCVIRPSYFSRQDGWVVGAWDLNTESHTIDAIKLDVWTSSWPLNVASSKGTHSAQNVRRIKQKINSAVLEINSTALNCFCSHLNHIFYDAYSLNFSCHFATSHDGSWLCYFSSCQGLTRVNMRQWSVVLDRCAIIDNRSGFIPSKYLAVSFIQ